MRKKFSLAKRAGQNIRSILKRGCAKFLFVFISDNKAKLIGTDEEAYFALYLLVAQNDEFLKEFISAVVEYREAIEDDVKDYRLMEIKRLLNIKEDVKEDTKEDTEQETEKDCPTDR